jgi:hypothetical protein
MKILIVGLPKSGTTALYFKLKQALPPGTSCLYEPPRFESSSTSEIDVLAKILISPSGDFDYPSFRGFDRRILIVRDPRDHFVSRLLYRACADPLFRHDDAKVSSFVEIMRQKEANPRSLSLLDLLDRYNSLRDEGRSPAPAEAGALPRSWAIGSYRAALEFHSKEDGLFIYRYEDFVAGDYRRLENHLQLAIAPGDTAVAPQYAHVTRTKSSGDWRHWFTQSDADFFRPYLLPYMRAYGYDDEWSLADRPTIAAEHASKFVLRTVAQRRQDTAGAPV